MNEEQLRIDNYLSKNALGYANRKTSTETGVNCDLGQVVLPMSMCVIY